MRIQSFRATIGGQREAVAEHLHDGLNVIGGGPLSQSISSQLANRLYGGDQVAGPAATISLANGGAAIDVPETTPAATAQTCLLSGDLPLLREAFVVEQACGETLRRKVHAQVCMCGRPQCPGARIVETDHARQTERADCIRRLEQARRQLLHELRQVRETSQRRQQEWDARDRRLVASLTEANREQDQLREQIRKLQARLESLDAQVARWETERAAIARERSRWHFTSGLALLETQLAEYDGNLVALGSEQVGLEQPPATGGRCEYMERASHFLQELTGGYFRNLTAVDGPAIDFRGNRHGWQSLSRSGRNLVRLSLSLAAAEQWKQEGVDLPLIVDDPFVHLRQDEVDYVVDCLQRFARGGHQVLLFTSDEIARVHFASERVAVKTHEPRRQPVVDETDTELDRPEEEPAAAPTLTPKQRLVAALREVGIDSTQEFLDNEPNVLAIGLQNHGYTAGELARWQDRIALLHFLPELTDDDAEVLTACGCDSLAALSEAEVDLLHEQILRFLRSDEGSHFRRLRTRYQRPRIREWRKLCRRRQGHWGRGAYGKRLERRWEDSASAVISWRGERAGKGSGRNGVGDECSTDKDVRRTGEDSQRFYLDPASPIVDAPTIGPKMAERLEAIGIETVADLLTADAASIARRLKHRRTKAEDVEEWQQQSHLMCRVPQLRGHDAQILVALGYTEPEQIAAVSPSELFDEVAPFCETKAGRRIIRTMDPPDLAEVSEWIGWCRQARTLRAA